MRGFNIAERGHVVNLIPPIDITGGKNSKIFNMAKWAHASIIIQVGVSAAAWTKIILNQCPDVTPTARVALPYALYVDETTGDDVLGVRTAQLAAGYTPSAVDNIFYVIELDHTELADGSGTYVEVQLTNGANSVIASAVAILTGARYAGQSSPTVIV